MQSRPSSPIHGFAEEEIPVPRVFNWPPLSPIDYTPTRPTRPLSRGRPLVRPSTRERWSLRRPRTEPGTIRSSLRSVPEDDGLNTTTSTPDLPANNPECSTPSPTNSDGEVFATPSGAAEPLRPARGRRRKRDLYTGPRRRSSRNHSSTSSNARALPQPGSNLSLAWDSTEELPSFLAHDPKELTDQTDSTQFSLTPLEELNLSATIRGLFQAPTLDLSNPAASPSPVRMAAEAQAAAAAAEAARVAAEREAADRAARGPEMIDKLERLIVTFTDDFDDYNP